MTASDSTEGVPEPALRPRGRPYRNVTSERSVSTLGLGMIIGTVLGVGIALMVAPQSGPETRRILARRARKLRRGRGVWMRLGRELRRAAAAKRKSLELEAKRNEIAARRAERGESTV